MSSTPEVVLEEIFRAWRKVRRRTAAGENLRHFKGGSRKNSFNNRGLITGAVGEVILPVNFGVARRGDTGQEGRAVVTSCGGILDVVGAEGPEVIDIDGGAVKLVAGTVEVAHADLAGTLRTVVVMEHSVMAHIFGAIAASGVTLVLLETGLHRRCRCPYCLLKSIPSFSP